MTTIELKCRLNPEFARVVQKANIGKSWTYALQMYKNDTYVCRAHNVGMGGKLDKMKQVLFLKGRSAKQIREGKNKQAAGDHTQTWEYAGPNAKEKWFIGSKTKDSQWSIQIARVNIPGTHTENLNMTRISNLVEISEDPEAWHGQHVKRVEAAVSPDYNYLLIATVWTNNSGHFGLYNLPAVNEYLNHHMGQNTTVQTLKDEGYLIKYVDIDDFVRRIGSIQGYDIDEYNNVYVSSQYAPNTPGVTEAEQKIRKIVKFNLDNPYGTWNPLDLTNDYRVNENYENNLSEFEGIQVRDVNDLFLTVSYHGKGGKGTVGSQVFHVKW